MLHGWGSSSAVMESLAGGLASSGRVLTLDMPGHGNSVVSSQPWGLEEQADAVRQAINHHFKDEVTLVGHSNGGRIGLYMASEPSMAPLINGLVLFSPSGIRRSPTLKTKLRRLTATALKAPFSLLPGRAREYGLDWLRHTLLWRALGSSDYRALDGVMRETFVRTVNAYVEDRLSEIHIPVLIFWGQNDHDIVIEQIRTLESKIPDAGVVIVDDAGHYPFLDREDLAVEGTLSFAESL